MYLVECDKVFVSSAPYFDLHFEDHLPAQEGAGSSKGKAVRYLSRADGISLAIYPLMAAAIR